MADARLPQDAAHVRAAVARDRSRSAGSAAQPRVAPFGLRTQPAVHVQAAHGKVAQARPAPDAGERRAPHVEAAVARTAGLRLPSVLLKKAGSVSQPRLAVPAVLQKMESIEARSKQFAAKREKLEEKAVEHWGGVAEEDHPMQDDEGSWHGRAKDLDELAEAAFGGISSRATGAVAMTAKGRILVAAQGGFASSHKKKIVELVWEWSGKHIGEDDLDFIDAGAPANLHAEMIFIWYFAKKGVESGIERVGVKDKGCCNLCSAVLGGLGIAFTRTESSKYEIQWQDPWEAAGKKSPLGKGSGVSSAERGLM